MPHEILVMFACNDPDNGEPTGHIDALHLHIGGDEVAELSAGIWPPSDCPKFTHLDGAVRISRRKFPIRSYSTWVGNWCWDAAAVSSSVAAGILNYLHEIGWHNEGGLCAIGDIWTAGRRFRPSDIASLALTDEELAARKAARI